MRERGMFCKIRSGGGLWCCILAVEILLGGGISGLWKAEKYRDEFFTGGFAL